MFEHRDRPTLKKYFWEITTTKVFMEKANKLVSNKIPYYNAIGTFNDERMVLVPEAFECWKRVEWGIKLHFGFFDLSAHSHEDHTKVYKRYLFSLCNVLDWDFDGQKWTQAQSYLETVTRFLRQNKTINSPWKSVTIRNMMQWWDGVVFKSRFPTHA